MSLRSDVGMEQEHVRTTRKLKFACRTVDDLSTFEFRAYSTRHRTPDPVGLGINQRISRKLLRGCYGILS